MRHKKKIVSFLVAASIIVMAFILFNSLSREVSKGGDLDNEIERLQGEINKLDSRNSALLGLSKELSDLEFLEGEARIKMGMKLPGETVAVINRATSTFRTEKQLVTPTRFAGAPARREPGEGGWGNAGRWWQYFFNNTDEHR